MKTPEAIWDDQLRTFISYGVSFSGWMLLLSWCVGFLAEDLGVEEVTALLPCILHFNSSTRSNVNFLFRLSDTSLSLCAVSSGKPGDCLDDSPPGVLPPSNISGHNNFIA
mmetsp:Transcript_1303/g.3268  ORF Transcript_1303/g.3268 Transcript_1303/m.3268 type:complete len:110 (-) Transcript_1303:853-1182(-)